MSIREIEVRHVWVCQCGDDDCKWAAEADSAGQAESLAEHHINEDIGDENPRPHYYHTVTITAHTVVGR